MEVLWRTAVILGLVSWGAGSAVAQAPVKGKASKPPAAEKPTPPATKSPAKAVEPATPQQAAKVLDLRTFPTLEGAKPGIRTLSTLLYDAKGDVGKAFDFQAAELKKRGFQEQKGGYRDPNNISGSFVKDGFYVRVSASSYADDGDKKGVANVSLINEGNVDPATLPVPKGVKPFYPQAYRAAYTTELKVAEAAEQCRKLLLAAGWEPYGQSPKSSRTDLPESSTDYFKKNAIKLQSWVQSAPAEGGKTVIQYDTDLLAADIPCPPDTADPRYYDDHKVLNFDSPLDQTEAILAFYRERLPKQGWKATTDKPVSDSRNRTHFLVFRNPEQELLSLDLKEYTDIIRVKLRHLTAAELEEEERLARELAAKQKAEAEERNRKYPLAVISPIKSKKLEKLKENAWEFTVPNGTCAAELEAFRKHYLKEGWTEEKGTRLEKTSGRMKFKKDKLELEFSYFDIGFGDAEISVHGSHNAILQAADESKAPAAKGEPAEKSTAEKPKTKPKASGLPGLPGLPDGVELPDDVKDELEKALKEVEKATPKKPAPPKK